MKNLIVTVSGQANTGKSTVIDLLARELLKKGASVTYTLEGTPEAAQARVENVQNILIDKHVTILEQRLQKSPTAHEAQSKKEGAAAEMYDALLEVKTFLGHIEPRVGEQAFQHIWGTVMEALKSAE